MRSIFIILFILIVPKVYSQINFQSDIDKMPLHPNIANQIVHIYSNYDFQIRFWIEGPQLRLVHKRLFIMTLIDGNWKCDAYKFVNSRRTNSQLIKKYTHIEDCDSIWNYFMQNNILELLTMETLKLKFNEIKKEGRGDEFIIADGINYSIEFLSKDKYKRLDYHCPVTYNKEYSEIPELSNISNIIRRIFILAKVRFEPC